MYPIRQIAKLILLGLVVFCHSADGQQTETPHDPGIVVVKSFWFRHTVVTTLSPNITLPGMPGDGPLTARGYPTSSGTSVSNSRRNFVYEATFRNDSGREVKTIHWDFVFLDPKKGTEMGRHHFSDDKKTIGKGDTTPLSHTSRLPPTNVIDVGNLGKEGSAEYTERIDIRCVLYKGDVYWQAAGATDAECSQLRKKLKNEASK